MKVVAEEFENEQKQENETASSTESESLFVEDNLELREMKFKDRMKIKRERLQKNMDGMSKSEKRKYLILYYKWYAIITVAILFVIISFAKTYYENSIPIDLSFAIVNSRYQADINTDFKDDFREKYNINPKHRIMEDKELYFGTIAYDDPNDQTYDYNNSSKIATMCFNNYYDVFISDMSGVVYGGKEGLFFPLEQYLPKEILDKVSDRIVETADNDGNVVPMVLDISDTEFAKNLDPGYDKVYLGFSGRTDKNYINSLRILDYILNLNIEITTAGRPVELIQ